jgi:hypothetical protein
MRLRAASTFVLALALASHAKAGAHRCWLASVTAEPGAVRLTFEATPQLRIRHGVAEASGSSTAGLVEASASRVAEHASGATVLLERGQVLEVVAVSSSRERCLLSPILGPQFVGVSVQRWFQPEGSPEPMFMGTAIKAK